MSTIINAPIMPLSERLTTTSDVQEFAVELQNQIFYKPVLFFRLMLTEPSLRDGKIVLNPEDGDPLEVTFATVDLVIIKKDGKVRFNVVKSAVTKKNELIQETMNLVCGEADIGEMIVNIVNILNTLLPAGPADDDFEETE